MKFTNDAVTEIAAVLEKHRSEFNDNRKGAEWRQIVLALAQAYPSDRAKLYNFFAEKTTSRNIPSGGAKIVQSIESSPVQVQGCKDCPSSATIVETRPEPRIFVMGEKKEAPVPKPEGKKPTHFDEAQEAFDSVDAVLESFESDPDMMREYAEKHNIIVGRATKPETIAQKIFEHYNSAE